MSAARAFIWSLLLCVTTLHAEQLRISAPSFRPGIRFPVRVQLLQDDGTPKKDAWSRPLIVTLSQSPNPTLTNVVTLESGIHISGSTFAGDSPLSLVAQSGAVSVERTVRPNLLPAQSFGGRLAGETSTWSGAILITNDVTIPAGHTLRIEPNTLVLVKGVTNGTSAPDILVEGTVESFGTEAEPILITCNDTNGNWGQIRHSSESKGTYRHTFIHRGGRASGEGHTGTGPVLRLNNADVRLEHCVISELSYDGRNIGKGMFARDSSLVIADTVFAEMRMGPEIEGTSLLCTNSYFLEMRGPDDADGIYLHEAEGKSLQLVNSVFIGGDDDAVDTLNSDVIVSNCVFRGWLNEDEDAKAISVFNGEVWVDRCLVADCFAGISAKTGSSARVHINHSTIITKTNGVSASWKSNATGPDIAIYVTNSIVRGNPAIRSDFGTTNVLVGFSNLSTEWDGLNITTNDPLFLSVEEHDFGLSPASPAINAGDPSTPSDPDGTPADQGAFPFSSTIYTASLHLESGLISLTLAGQISGHAIVTEASDNLAHWSQLSRTNVTGTNLVLSDPFNSNTRARFYRFRVE